MLPLLLPWIVIALVIAALILSFCKKWRIGTLIIVFSVIVNWWCECIPFRLWPQCENAGPRSISVLTFNINGTKENIDERSEKLVKLIRKNSSDIIYISELGVNKKPFLDSLLTKDYIYTLFGNSHGFYSKYPLLKGKISGKDDFVTIDVVKCLSVVGEDTITLWGCHFASNNYTVESKYITPDSINSYGTFIQYVDDIKLAYSKRIKGAEIITGDECNMENPIVVLGDMNDVGGSKTIRLLEDLGLKDAWWEGGFGYGATIHKPSPYRIDHILHSKQLKLNNVKVVSSEGLSDHDAVFAEFSY